MYSQLMRYGQQLRRPRTRHQYLPSYQHHQYTQGDQPIYLLSHTLFSIQFNYNLPGGAPLNYIKKGKLSLKGLDETF